jgi:thymidylate synthase
MASSQESSSYLALITRILDHGEHRNGRNGGTVSLFGERLEFDLKVGFPLMTTKRVFWRGIVEELLWFMRGSTDANELSDKGVHIWDGNTSRAFLDSVGLRNLPEGSIGPGYGFQWRNFGGAYPSMEGGVDQLRYIIEELTNNPTSRRAVLSAWNPMQLKEMALPPCHITYIFHLSERDGLSCQMQMRSCDVCAGLPFNIASTALLTTLIAKVLHVQLGRVVVVTGDTHIYAEHVKAAKMQVARAPYAFPELVMKKEAPDVKAPIEEKIKWLEGLAFEDLELLNYTCHPALKYPMIA